jgi:predicted Zn-ribbon and HTH transcriptional regulator
MDRRRVRSRPDAELLGALAREGCPICHMGGRCDEQFFFWFLNENYSEPHTLEGLARSLGFCLAHGEALTRNSASALELTTVFSFLVRRMRERLIVAPAACGDRDAGPPRRTGPCPACRTRWEQDARNAFRLAGILGDASLAGAYGEPGLLCYPHLRLVVPLVGPAVFGSVLRLHRGAMETALDGLSTAALALESSPRESRPDLLKALLPALSLAVGHERDTGAYPAPDDERVPSGRRDPVAEFLAACRGAACPVCLEVRRAWIERMRWLDEAVAEERPVDDLLPTCPDHAWAAVHRGSARLALRTARRVIEATLAAVDVAQRCFTGAVFTERRPGWLGRMVTRLTGPRRRLAAARAALGRPIRCPVCERQAAAADRAIELLFTLLEDRPSREAVEEGYGLCLHHFDRAMGLDPPGEVVTALERMEAAKLARLSWELGELHRKAAWQWRAEEKGEEQTAWRRAVLRFSGSLGDTWR